MKNYLCRTKKELNNLISNWQKIIEYIKGLEPNTIDKFVIYSKHYPSIIELERKIEKDIFEDVLNYWRC